MILRTSLFFVIMLISLIVAPFFLRREYVRLMLKETAVNHSFFLADFTELALNNCRGSSDSVDVQNLIINDSLVVIDLWATWCKPCIQEMPILADVKEVYSRQPVSFASICLDDTVKSPFRHPFAQYHLDCFIETVEMWSKASLKNKMVLPTHLVIASDSLIFFKQGAVRKKEEMTLIIDHLLKNHY